MAIPPFDPASEPLGSFHPVVRKINSTNFDLAMHSPDKTWIDRFNEIRKTWAAIETEIEGLLIAGGKIFETEAQGRAAAEDGQYFFAESDDPDVSKSLYQRVSESESRWVADDPSAEFVRGAVAASTAALELASSPGRLSGEFYTSDTPTSGFSIVGDDERAIAEWDEDGYLQVQTRGEFHTADNQEAFAFTDENGFPFGGVSVRGLSQSEFTGEFFTADGQSYVVWADENGFTYYELDESGAPVTGGVSLRDLPGSDQHITSGEPWNALGSVSIKASAPSIVDSHTNDLFPDAASVYAHLDAIASGMPDYVTRHHAGDDGQGNPIYYYTARPPDYVVLGQSDLPQGEPGGSYYQSAIERPKIVLITGVHGNETHNVMAAIAFFEDLCKNWELKPGYDSLRWGIELIFVPVACPTGFNARTRLSWNGVNIARNFPSGWDDLTTDQKGDAPASELETQALITVMTDHSDAIGVIDSHRKFRIDNGYESLIWLSAEGIDVGLALDFINDHISFMKRSFDFLDDSNTPVGSLGSHINGSVAKHAYDQFLIPAFLLETPNALGPSGFGSLREIHTSAQRATLRLICDIYDRYRRTPRGIAVGD